MTTTANDKWLDELIMELRLREVPGPRIGDAVASARELLADTGQPAHEAFGSARDYAAALELSPTPTMSRVVSWLWAPIIGLMAFLSFIYASTAWFQGEPLLFSLAQLALCAVTVVIVFALPLYLGALLRHRWALIPFIGVGVVAGFLSGVVAPASAADAWLVSSPLPWLIATAIIMLALSLWSTSLATKNRDRDAIVEPLAEVSGTSALHRRSPAVFISNWLFPLAAAITFCMNWALTR